MEEKKISVLFAMPGKEAEYKKVEPSGEAIKKLLGGSCDAAIDHNGYVLCFRKDAEEKGEQPCRGLFGDGYKTKQVLFGNVVITVLDDNGHPRDFNEIEQLGVYKDYGFAHYIGKKEDGKPFTIIYNSEEYPGGYVYDEADWNWSVREDPDDMI